jgi:hypothetical protein
MKHSSYLKQLRSAQANGNGQAPKRSVLQARLSKQRMVEQAAQQPPKGWIRGMRQGEFIRISDFCSLIVSIDYDGTAHKSKLKKCFKVVIQTPGQQLLFVGEPARQLLQILKIPEPPTLNLDMPEVFESVDEIPDD